MRTVESSRTVGCKGHHVPLAERMVQRPCHIVGQAFRTHLVINGVPTTQRRIAFEIFAHLGGAVINFICGTADEFGSSPDVVVHSRNLGLAHPVGPQDPGAKPLRMVDQQMKRRPLDRNAARWSRTHSSAKMLSRKRSSRVSFVSQYTTLSDVTESTLGGAFMSCSCAVTESDAIWIFADLSMCASVAHTRSK